MEFPKSSGSLTLLALSGDPASGTITGSVNLAGGTGPLDVEASMAVFTNSTSNGQVGEAAADNTFLLPLVPPGIGPYTIDGFPFFPPISLNQGGAAAAISSLIDTTTTNPSDPTSPNQSGSTAEALAATLTIIPPTNTNAATGAVAATTESGSGGSPSVADEAAGYVVVSSNTGPVTQQQPQSQGNSKLVLPNFPNLYLEQNTGIGGGTSGGNEIPNPPSL